MKSIVSRLGVLLAAVAITGSVALGQATKKEVTFAKPVTVNGTVVKSGTYEVTFDTENNQLTILRGKKVVAKAEARIEKAEGLKHLYVTRADSDDATKPQILLSVGLKDGNQATLVNGNDNKAMTTER